MNSFLKLLLAGQSADKLCGNLPRDISYDQLADGVIRFEPVASEAPVLDLVISCGIHGNETAPVELVDRLIGRIMNGDLPVRSRVLFVFGNLLALRRGVRFVEEDMNRLFCGPVDAEDSSEQRRATLLELCLMRFFSRSLQNGTPRLHYDLHTTIHGSRIEKFAVYPLPGLGKHFESTEIARLGRMGIEAILLQSAEVPTFSFFSSRFCGAAAFTVELGHARPFGENSELDLSVLENRLSLLISDGLEAEESGSDTAPDVQLFRVSRELIKQTDNFRLLLDAKTDDFTPLPQGFCIAEDAAGPVLVREENARLVFADPGVAVGQRAGLIIIPAQSVRELS